MNCRERQGEILLQFLNRVLTSLDKCLKNYTNTYIYMSKMITYIVHFAKIDHKKILYFLVRKHVIFINYFFKDLQ